MRSDKLRLNTKFIRLSGIESDKSIVDDFDIKLGTVSVRVGLSYDPLRLSPSLGDLYNAIAYSLRHSKMERCNLPPRRLRSPICINPPP